ncbi:hypothetical protein A2300_03900 [Candidatus Falkowbacteria bacterium RIFOXYB2_FULL_35_7]|nr:MAG: hypothetical protein A2300_03900 [Candidatus Falkowbacteria bacterium RIFOXYB2_FULL_35_7]
MLNKLPLFAEYVVDIRLKQFRRVKRQKIEFIDFQSLNGEKLLNRYIQSLDPKSIEFKKLIKNF